MRTNIVIDDKLMKETLRLTGLKTKREAVELVGKGERISTCGETPRTVRSSSGRNAMDKLPNAVPAGLQSPQSIPRQMNMRFDTVELQEMSAAQHARAITHRESLL